MSDRTPREVFLSHSDLDREACERVANTLVDHGVPVWFSRQRLQGAQIWHDEIGLALERADWVILLGSPNAIASLWVNREMRYVFGDPRFEGRIVPVMLEHCDLGRISWILPSIQRIDFRDFDSGMRELLATWGIGYRP